jgi:UrcA family protein
MLVRRQTLIPIMVMGVIAGAAIAQSATQTATGGVAKVFVGDLDLTSSAGADAALQRIAKAANSVCGYRPLPFDLDGGAEYRKCVKSAVDGAVGQLHAPVLAARSAGRFQLAARR